MNEAGKSGSSELHYNNMYLFYLHQIIKKIFTQLVIFIHKKLSH